MDFFTPSSSEWDVVIVSMIGISGNVVNEVAAVWTVEDEPELSQVHYPTLCGWIRLYLHQLCCSVIAELHSPLMLDARGLAV